MPLEVYNTLGRAKVPFEPLTAGQVRMYACGPTVYDDGHIGHARAAVVFDMVRRWLAFKGLGVTYVRNYTDVDDKIINRANELGVDYQEVAEKYTRQYEDDVGRLLLLEPDVKPKVSEHIPDIIAMVKTLVDKGAAYEAAGSVYFAVDKFAGYGKLSGRTREDMENVARVDHDPYKENELDFALWKAAKPGEPSWESPWGPGRPGWHIECSVMSSKYLGKTFDIHGGGRDLIFPHHENEIAQSEAANGTLMAKYWLHNGHVTKDGVKISKSLGNFIPLKDLYKSYDPEAIKFFLFGCHYSSPLDFTDPGLRQAERNLERFYEALDLVDALAGDDQPAMAGVPLADELAGLEAKVTAAMDDDFNTAKALAALFDFLHALNQHLAGKKSAKKPGSRALLKKAAAELRRLGGVLGLFSQDPAAYLGALTAMRVRLKGLDPSAIAARIEERKVARAAKDFARADQVRAELAAQGVILEDTPQGTKWRVEM
ncbi:MAG TPA: cysteine--tRNA ligase [bacterium]|nr:cysteine--tRNA ligase [bacterium]